ncbi:hypothetical protein BC941DRAFT_454259 [Chlamydoabsidia padenii]|nr:hypothetical protein BC941DRAFT_454259 [Chlamydoabsidia padenii]
MKDNDKKLLLPSLKLVCQDLISKEETKPHGSTRHHYRARSQPTALPSQPPASAAIKQHNEASAMNILLGAIALDQKMTMTYKNERVKSFVREQQWLHKTQESSIFKTPICSDHRRRSRSAPGAPIAHYYNQVALNATRWYLPNHGELEPCSDSHDIAHALVKQHLKSAASACQK